MGIREWEGREGGGGRPQHSFIAIKISISKCHLTLFFKYKTLNYESQLTGKLQIYKISNSEVIRCHNHLNTYTLSQF